MQRLTLVVLTVPYRHHIRVANRIIHRQLQHSEFHGVERINPPWAPAWTRVHPSKLLLLFYERFLGLRDERCGKAVETALDTYALISRQAVALNAKSDASHLEDLDGTLRLFKRLAELDYGLDQFFGLVLNDHAQTVLADLGAGSSKENWAN